jgi:cobalamin biosynthesis Mg chelatase CobN
MNNARLRMMAGLAGVTLAFYAAAGYGQNTTPTTTGGAATTPTADQSAQQPTATTPSTGTQAAPTGTDATIGTTSRTTTTATDISTTQPTTTTFWLSGWGIVAIAVVAILLLWAIFGRRDRTVVRDTYSSSSTTRNVGPTNERVVSPRAASGTETTTRVTDTDTRL